MRAISGFFCNWIAEKYNIPYIYVEGAFLTLIYGIYIFTRGRLALDSFDIIVYFGLIIFNILIYFIVALLFRDMEIFYELFRKPKK